MAISLAAGCAADASPSNDLVDSSDPALPDAVAQTGSERAVQPGTALSLSAASDTALEGRFVDGDGSEVRFAVRASSETTFHLDAHVGAAHLEVEANTDSLSLYSNGHQAVLSAAQRRALFATSDALRRQLGDELGVMG